MNSKTTLVLLSSLLAAACGGEPEVELESESTRAASDTTRQTLSIHTWDTTTQEGARMIIGRDGTGSSVQRFLVLTEADDAITLTGDGPLYGDLSISSSGAITETNDEQLRAFAAALYADTTRRDLAVATTPGITPSQGKTLGSLQTALTSDNLSYDITQPIPWSLFGYGEYINVGSFCWGGYERQSSYAYVSNGIVGNVNCNVEDWSTHDARNCGVRIYRGAKAWQSGSCRIITYQYGP